MCRRRGWSRPAAGDASQGPPQCRPSTAPGSCCLLERCWLLQARRTPSCRRTGAAPGSWCPCTAARTCHHAAWSYCSGWSTRGKPAAGGKQQLAGAGCEERRCALVPASAHACAALRATPAAPVVVCGEQLLTACQLFSPRGWLGRTWRSRCLPKSHKTGRCQPPAHSQSSSPRTCPPHPRQHSQGAAAASMACTRGGRDMSGMSGRHAAHHCRSASCTWQVPASMSPIPH